MREPAFTTANAAVYRGHVMDVLAEMETASVDLICTSPPYWSLRLYGTEPQVWPPLAPLFTEDGRSFDPATCDHVWGDMLSGDPKGGSGPGGKHDYGENFASGAAKGKFCEHCSSWVGELGGEPTPDLFVDHLVLIFRECRRVLKPTGLLFLNLGDSYAGSVQGVGATKVGAKQATNKGSDMMRLAAARSPSETLVRGRRMQRGGGRWGGGDAAVSGLKAKDLIGIPWRVALALQSDGWWLRSAIVWHKGNTFPESVTDRPTGSYEHIFMLARSERYYFDAFAVQEPFADERMGGSGTKCLRYSELSGRNGDSGLGPSPGTPGRNIRDVWSINTERYGEGHFATWPRALVERMVMMGSSGYGVCAVTGNPYEREIERPGSLVQRPRGSDPSQYRSPDGPQRGGIIVAPARTIGWTPTCGKPFERELEKEATGRVRKRSTGGLGTAVRREPQGLKPVGGEFQEGVVYKTVGWKSTCGHGAEVIPATILDPFMGSGTTGLVAVALGRRFIGIDLNGSYLKLAQRRIAEGELERSRGAGMDAPLKAEVVDDLGPLWSGASVPEVVTGAAWFAPAPVTPPPLDMTKCRDCGQPTTHECSMDFMNMVCGNPLCDEHTWCAFHKTLYEQHESE